MVVASVHDLYAVDPAEFVSARAELVRQLKADGQREDAAAVKALRRPTVPVWALNRVARDDGDAIDALLSAATAAREAQDALLAGDVDREALREALARRRTALHDVVHRASDVIEASGRAAAAQQRQVESALNTVVGSDELAELLRTGELVDVAEDEADGDLAALLGASAAQGETKKTRPVSDIADARAAKQEAAARKEAAQRKAAAEAAAAALDEAQQVAVEADVELERAQAGLRRAEEKAEEAQAALQRAEEAARSGGGDD
jgi:hypothetical protein